MDGNIWINTALFQDSSVINPHNYNKFSYRFNYRTGLDKFIKHGKFSANSKFLAGLQMNRISLEKSDYKKKTVFIQLLKPCIDLTKMTSIT